MTEDEVVHRLMLAIDHPFGGHGAPFGNEIKPLIAELLAHRAAAARPDKVGRRQGWPDADLTALRLLAHFDTPLLDVAAALGRDPMAVFWKATKSKGLRHRWRGVDAHPRRADATTSGDAGVH